MLKCIIENFCFLNLDFDISKRYENDYRKKKELLINVFYWLTYTIKNSYNSKTLLNRSLVFLKSLTSHILMK